MLGLLVFIPLMDLKVHFLRYSGNFTTNQNSYSTTSQSCYIIQKNQLKSIMHEKAFGKLVNLHLSIVALFYKDKKPHKRTQN